MILSVKSGLKILPDTFIYSLKQIGSERLYSISVFQFKCLLSMLYQYPWLWLVLASDILINDPSPATHANQI